MIIGVFTCDTSAVILKALELRIRGKSAKTRPKIFKTGRIIVLGMKTHNLKYFEPEKWLTRPDFTAKMFYM